MSTTVLFIYVAVSLRVFIAQRLNNFKRPKYRLVVANPALECRLHLISKMMLLLSVLLWPVFFILEPKLFVQAFLLGQQNSLTQLNFKQGMWAVRFFLRTDPRNE